jgi:hypothetical protein
VQLDKSNKVIGVFNVTDIVSVLNHNDGYANKVFSWTMSPERVAIARLIFVSTILAVLTREQGGQEKSACNKYTTFLNNMAIMKKCEVHLANVKNCSFPIVPF